MTEQQALKKMQKRHHSEESVRKHLQELYTKR